MSKQTRQVRAHAGAAGNSFEHLESVDDSLLPVASELAQLQVLDPNITEWMKERTAKEQDARLDFNDRKMSVLEGAQTNGFIIDLITIISAFLIIISGIAFSAFLIYKGLNLEGSLFAGGTIIFAANAFLKFRKPINQNNTSKK